MNFKADKHYISHSKNIFTDIFIICTIVIRWKVYKYLWFNYKTIKYKYSVI